MYNDAIKQNVNHFFPSEQEKDLVDTGAYNYSVSTCLQAVT